MPVRKLGDFIPSHAMSFHSCVIICDLTFGEHPIFAGEETPPRLGGSLPPLYNSLRSTHAPRSEIGSYFYAQQVCIHKICLSEELSPLVFNH